MTKTRRPPTNVGDLATQKMTSLKHNMFEYQWCRKSFKMGNTNYNCILTDFIKTYTKYIGKGARGQCLEPTHSNATEQHY